MSLSVEDTENEQNEKRSLQGQLEATNSLVRTLSLQLAELRDQVSPILIQMQKQLTRCLPQPASSLLFS